VEILSDWMGRVGAGQMLARWAHYLAGVAWVGLLYYFNFVQAPAFHEMGADSRSDALQQIARRAMRWTRWSALATLLSGVLILAFQRNLGSNFTDYFAGTRGTAIAFGVVLGIVMFLNVWLVIYPNHKKVVTAAEDVVARRRPDSDVGMAAKRLSRAQRANALFSIPLLWFMGAAPHFAAERFAAFPGRDLVGSAWVIFIIIVGFIELSALGQIGGIDSVANRAMFDDYRYTIAWGFILWAVLWIGGFEAVLGRF
jgi:uncharacterized membrane protein